MSSAPYGLLIKYYQVQNIYLRLHTAVCPICFKELSYLSSEEISQITFYIHYTITGIRYADNQFIS